ncbi:MAG: copper-binding protein [Deltaproteobacteria bacterium]|nr:copper-binding protein [Deltaproteobacteria bacterium]
MGLLMMVASGLRACFVVLGGVWMLVLVGCSSEEGGPGRYAARGVVEDVDVEGRQVLIDHGDVEGLMPAMTMNFAVPDTDVLELLAPGQVIEFRRGRLVSAARRTSADESGASLRVDRSGRPHREPALSG